MAIGDRIKSIRNLRNMTQKQLGLAAGFHEKAAGIRIAQYESGVRKPKKNMVTDIAHALEVSPRALDIPDIGGFAGLAHTLFALEDIYGLHIGSIEGELCLRLDKSRADSYPSMSDLFAAWQREADKSRSGKITQEEYNTWRFNYPSADAGAGESKPSPLAGEKRSKP